MSWIIILLTIAAIALFVFTNYSKMQMPNGGGCGACPKKSAATL